MNGSVAVLASLRDDGEFPPLLRHTVSASRVGRAAGGVSRLARGPFPTHQSGMANDSSNNDGFIGENRNWGVQALIALAVVGAVLTSFILYFS